jgi:tetratricopeptide (TPR) repeat protein
VSTELETAHETALRTLERDPDDVDALRAAGRAAFELGLDDAETYFRRVAELRPDEPESWQDLADALVYQGRLGEASDAFRRLVRMQPDDVRTLIDLAHVTYGTGDVGGAIELLERAVAEEPESTAALRSLGAMYRRAGRRAEAFDVGKRLAESEPDDVPTTLDVAELALELRRLDDAVVAFSRLRTIDPEPEHAVFAYHGMLDAELRRGRWRRALDLAIDATRVDRYGRTTDLLAYAVAQVFGDSERRAPSRGEVDAALAASHAEHRRLHAESLDL